MPVPGLDVVVVSAKGTWGWGVNASHTKTLKYSMHSNDTEPMGLITANY